MTEESTENALPVDITMRRPTLAGIPTMPRLEAPLVVGSARVDEAAELARLLGRAYEGETWAARDVEREVLCDASVKQTLVVAAGARLVATASLQVRPESATCGWVRWVGTDPGRRREGLARTVVIGVLEMAVRAGCVDACLSTRTDRLAAVALYMGLGFGASRRVDGCVRAPAGQLDSRRTQHTTVPHGSPSGLGPTGRCSGRGACSGRGPTWRLRSNGSWARAIVGGGRRAVERLDVGRPGTSE
jgi:GNAT superfamily N-acetyltransferase